MFSVNIISTDFYWLLTFRKLTFVSIEFWGLGQPTRVNFTRVIGGLVDCQQLFLLEFREVRTTAQKYYYLSTERLGQLSKRPFTRVFVSSNNFSVL